MVLESLNIFKTLARLFTLYLQNNNALVHLLPMATTRGPLLQNMSYKCTIIYIQPDLIKM